MKLTKIALILVVVLIVGGIGFIASTDINVQQQTITETIPNERFFNND